MDERLIDYIKKVKQKGISDARIIKELSEAGYNKDDIKKAFNPVNRGKSLFNKYRDNKHIKLAGIIFIFLLILLSTLYYHPFFYFVLRAEYAHCPLEITLIGDGPAKSAGLKIGDRIETVDGVILGTRNKFFKTETITEPFAQYVLPKERIVLATVDGSTYVVIKNKNEQLGVTLSAGCRGVRETEGIQLIGDNLI